MCGIAKVHSPAFSIGREYPRIVLYVHSLSIFICLFFLFYIQTFIIMLCYLQSAELRPRDGKLPFFICKWQGVIGDTSADKVTDEGNGVVRINVKAALARNITLTKSIFPADEEALSDWKKLLKCRVMYVPEKNEDGTYKKDDNGNYILNEKVKEENKNKCVVNLLYKQVDLASISDEVKRIEYTTSDGRIMKQSFITVIGFADEKDVWAEEITPEEMAANNLRANLANGTYIDISDEEEEKEAKPTKAESKKSTQASDDDWD